MNSLKTLKTLSFCMLIFLLISMQSIAADRYWVGTNSNKNWNVIANWSATSGGSGGASVPGSADDVYFDNGGTGQCTINAAVNVKLLTMTSGYTDTVKQNAFVITTKGMVLNGGTFSGGTSNIAVNGPFTLAGCTYKSTSAIITIKGNYTYSSGYFIHNNGYAKLNGIGNISISGNTNFYDLDFYGSGVTYTLNDTTILSVAHTLFLSSSSGGLIGGQIYAKGNIQENSLTSNNGAHTTVIEINGTGDQYIQGHTNPAYNTLGWMPDMKVNKTSGTVYLTGCVTIRKTWEVIQGNVDAITYNSTLCFPVGFAGGNSGGIIKGKKNQRFNNILVSTYGGALHVFTASDSIQIDGELTINGNGPVVIEGYIHAKGNISLLNGGTTGGGTGTVVIDGSGTQVITGNSLANTSELCNLTINKSTTDTLILKNTISIAGNWNHVSGIVDAQTNSSTVAFCNGTRTIHQPYPFYNVAFVAIAGICTNTIPVTDTITVLGSLAFSGNSTLYILEGTIDAKGNITAMNANQSSNGTGWIHICGTGDQTFTGNNETNKFLGALCNINIDKSSGTLTLVNNIQITYPGASYYWRYTKGIVNPGTSRVIINGNYGYINCVNGSESMSFNNLWIRSGSPNLAGDLYVSGDLYILDRANLRSDPYTITIKGNWVNEGDGALIGGTSKIIVNGTTNQNFTSTAAQTFHELKIDKSYGKVYLKNALTLSGALTLTKGVLVSTATNMISVKDNATVSEASNQSFIAGPVTKIGDDAFTFPVGDTTLTDSARYHPFAMTAPAGAASSFTAQYYAKNQLIDHPTFTSYASTLKPISTCEYWSLTRNAGTSVVTPTVGWNANTCNIDALADARVASWSGTTWADLGQNSTTGNQTAGTVKANTAGPNTANQYYVLAERMPTPIANQRYWIGNGSNKSWNNTANWAAVSGGPGGNPVPTQNDTVVFDGGGKGEADLDVNVSVAKLLVKSTYNTNAIVQGTYTITVGTGGMILNGGSFTGGNAAITNNGSLTLGGTNFTSTSATFTVYGTYTKTGGSFTHNNGKILFKTGISISGSTDFYDLELSPTGDAIYTLVSSDVLNVMGEFKLSGAPLININSGTIHAQGDVTLANTHVDILGSYTLLIDGTGTQTINGAAAKWQSALSNVVITKTAGTVVLKDFITVKGNWTNTNNTEMNVSNTSTVVFNGGSKTISGNTTFKNLNIISDALTDGVYTIPSGNTITTEGELKLEGNRSLYLNGTIHAKGNIVAFHGSGSLVDGGTGSITINGTGDQLFSGYDTPKAARLCNIIIDKVSGTLTLDKYLTPGHNWTHVKGTMNPGTSTVYFTNSNNRTVSGKNKFNDVVFYGELTNSDTTTVVDTMTVEGELKYLSKAMTINGGTIAGKGNITINNGGDVIPGTYTLWITGTNNQLLTGTGVVQLRPALNNVIIEKTGGLLSLKDKICVKGNWIYHYGNLDAKTNLSTLALHDGNRIFSGNHTLYNLTLLGYDVNDPSTSEIPEHDTITVEGEFKIDGNYPAYLNTGTINATGSIRSLNTTTAKSGGTATLNICGLDDQSFSGLGNGAGRFCNIKINKPSGILNLSGNITVGASNWTYVKGTVNSGTSRVVFWGDGTVTTSNGTSAMEFYHFEVQNGSVTMLSPFIARKDFKTSGSTTLITNSHDIFVGGYFQNGGVFNMGTTTITFNGAGRQDAYTSTNTSYYKIVINKPSGDVFVDGVFAINTNLNLIKGALVPRSSSTGHYVKILDNATVTGGSNASYVMCGVMKVGDDAFTFPVGDTTLPDSSKYHPFSIPAPATSATYTVRYYAKKILTDHPTFTTIQSPLQSISNCEYWYVEGGPALTPTLSWNANNSNVNALADIRVATWDGTQWKSLGNNATTGNLVKGTIQAADISTGTYDKYFVVGNINDVHLDPVASFLNPGGTCVNTSITFTNTSSHASSYQWKVNNANVSTSTNLTHAFTTTGTYTITLVANNGTVTNTKDVNFVVGSGITADAGPDKTITTGGSVDIGGTPTATTGTAPFTYIWSPSTNLSSSAVSNPIANPVVNTVYTLIVQDAQGCSGTDAVQVTVEENFKSYAELKKALDAGYYQVNATDHTLYFKYMEEYKSGNLIFKIYDNTHELKSCPTVITKQYGDNRFGIDLNGCLGASTSTYYLLEVINDKSEKLILKFKY